MQVLFLILNNPDYLEDVLSLLSDHEVGGATILESQGMGSTIVNNRISDLPLFGSLKSLLKDGHVYNKTIFTVIRDEQKLNNVVQALKQLQEKEENAGLGMMFSLPIAEIY